MPGRQDMLMAWLNDAYAMENTIVQTLEEHFMDLSENHQMAEKMPGLKGKVSEHLGKTKRHADLVRQCVERLGGDVSKLKTVMAEVGAKIEAKPAGLAKDAVIKNLLAEYTAEHMEIGSYTALIASAQELGDQDTVRVCEEILSEEEEMAGWISEQMPVAVQEFLRIQE